MQHIRVGVIGTGFMGKAHSLALAAMPMFFWPAPAIPVRASIASSSREGAEIARQRYGFERGTDDWRTLIDDQSIDVINIATPNHLHAEMALAAAAAGKHILCEKPLGRNGAESKRMLDAVGAAGVVHMVAFNYRKIPAVALAAQQVAAGRIGKVLNFRASYLQDWSADPSAPASWRFRAVSAGSGAVGDLGTHIIDLARFLVGEIEAVCGLTRTIVPRRPSQAGSRDELGAGRSSAVEVEIDVDDEMLTILRFANGAVGSLEATRNAHGRHNALTFEIHGSTGSLCFDYERRDQLRIYDALASPDERGFTTITTGPTHPYGNGLWPIPALGIGYSEIKIVEAYDLMRAITQESPAGPDFHDGWRASAIADAVLESAADGSWVST